MLNSTELDISTAQKTKIPTNKELLFCCCFCCKSIRCCIYPQGREGGGGGGVLIFSYIRRLGSFFFWVQNFELQYFWGFQKNKFCFGYEDFVDIFGGSSQNWTILRGHFYAF